MPKYPDKICRVIFKFWNPLEGEFWQKPLFIIIKIFPLFNWKNSWEILSRTRLSVFWSYLFILEKYQYIQKQPFTAVLQNWRSSKFRNIHT